MPRGASFGKDPGLQARMVGTLFALGLLYVVFMGVLFAALGNAGPVIIICLVFLLFQYFTADKLALRSMHAHEVTPEQAPELHALVDRLCLQADLPKPKVAIADDRMPNAFAIGRSRKSATVAVTTGLLELLPPAELEGVLAHELAHIAHKDVAVMTLASFFASLAAMIVQNAIWFGGGDSDDDDGPGLLAVIAVSALVYAVSFFLLRALSRYREYAADRGAAVVTGRPSALAAALVRISDGIERTPQQDLREVGAVQAFYILPPRAKSAISGLFSTHPSMEKRIAALQKIETELQLGRTA
ncbi:zinc metalloprotease HtpX [Patulibacter minatonensis]|uniref:zinc metalloprotease HtpX n=1 Tax=Patulibacter minatonensis TaxID=298163 RepID=UPI00047E6C94|nr:zinc metalloprotease HtpX [Patulibacter minatonensis]